MMTASRPHIVLGVTGSIAAYKAGDLIRRLQERGCRVSVVMTRAAQKFITPMTLGVLSGEAVIAADLSETAPGPGDHIALAGTADALLIAPATANIIAKMAAGLADDTLTCLFLASKAPVLVAPAMNEGMFHHPLVQANVQKLKDLGVAVIGPETGLLACGIYGEGHLAGVDTIVETVLRTVGHKNTAR